MDALAQAIRDLDEKRVNELVEEKIKAGVPALRSSRSAMKGWFLAIYFEGVYFISELIFRGDPQGS